MSQVAVISSKPQRLGQEGRGLTQGQRPEGSETNTRGGVAMGREERKRARLRRAPGRARAGVSAEAGGGVGEKSAHAHAEASRLRTGARFAALPAVCAAPHPPPPRPAAPSKPEEVAMKTHKERLGSLLSRRRSVTTHESCQYPTVPSPRLSSSSSDLNAAQGLPDTPKHGSRDLPPL